MLASFLIRPIPLLLSMLLAQPALAAQGAVAAGDTLPLSKCELLGSGGFSAISARCGRLQVAENPADPDSRTIELFVAVVPAQAKEATRDALTFLAGGPGQAATTAFVDLSHAFSEVRRDRDILLVDQRGTGKSAALECAQDESSLAVTPSNELLLQSIRDCLAGLDGDPRYYTTSIAVDDLERVRKALGYEQLNVYGGSYGTRVGLHYLRKYPASVRTLIIDGVVPSDFNLGPGIALAAQGALENMFNRCAKLDVCRENFGDVREQFEALQAGLRKQAMQVTLPHPVGGSPETVAFGADRFALAVRLLSYAPETVALMPLLLHKAAAENYPAPLAAQAVMIEKSLSDALSYGMHNSVVCTEDVPFYESQAIDREALRATYLGESQLNSLKSICELWPAGVIDDDFKRPVVSDLPILLLSGSADPVTPPAYAEHAARTLSKHLHLVGKDMGHILAPVGCVPRLIGQYVRQASLDDLDGRCVDDVRPLPFFTSFNGPEP